MTEGGMRLKQKQHCPPLGHLCRASSPLPERAVLAPFFSNNPLHAFIGKKLGSETAGPSVFSNTYARAENVENVENAENHCASLI